MLKSSRGAGSCEGSLSTWPFNSQMMGGGTMYVTTANGQGKCYECKKAIERGSRQLIVTVKDGQYYADRRLCCACALREVRGVLSGLEERVLQTN